MTPARAVLVLLLAGCAFTARAEGIELSLVGSPASSVFGGKLMNAVEGMASSPVHTSYKETPNDNTAHGEFNPPDYPQAALTTREFETSSVLDVPLAFSTLSIYANIPAVTKTINMTSCLLAQIFNGGLTNWKDPKIVEENPEVSKILGDKTVTEILVVRPKKFVNTEDPDAPFDPADEALLKEFLKASCTDGDIIDSDWEGDYTSDLVSPPPGETTTFARVDDPLGIAKMTPMSITFSTTAQGTASGSVAREVAIKNRKGTYITATKALEKPAYTIKAIRDLYPESLNPADFSGNKYHAWDLDANGVYPITMLHFIHTPKNVYDPQWSDHNAGALLQAICNFSVSESGQKLLDGTGLNSLYDTDADGGTEFFADLDNPSAAWASLIDNQRETVKEAMSEMILVPNPNPNGISQTSYVLEYKGEYADPSLDREYLSENREDWSVKQLVQLQRRVSELEHQVEMNQNIVLQGSGSSASAAVVWHLMRNFMASASTPVWMYYRAIGSAAGQRESTATNNNFESWNDFAVSDKPLAAKDWNRLLQDSIVARRGKPLNVPIGIAAMNFFVSIPEDLLPDRKLKMTPCDLTKIYTGKTKSWSEFGLDAKDITFFYRVESGSTALITSYLTEVCPEEWTYSEKGEPTIPGFASVENGRLADTTMDLVTKMVENPWSIGYMDAGAGQSNPYLVEVSLRVAESNPDADELFLTSREAKISDAASQILQSGAWPDDPRGDFSELNLLNQPGRETWPLVYMPFIIIHENLMSLGAKGPLLVAFIKYMLAPEVQQSLKAENIEPLPNDVMNYIKTRTMTLFMTDPKYPQWVYEGDRLEYEGAMPFRFSAPDINSDYNVMSLNRVKTDLGIVKSQTDEAAFLNVPQLFNNTETEFANNLASVKKDLEDKIKEFESLAIAGIIFGIIGAVIAILTVARSVAKGLGGKNMRNNSSGNMFGMSSDGGLRRKQSSLEEGIKPLTAADESGSLPHSLP